MVAQLEPLYDKQVKCPICTNTVSTKKIRSRFVRVEKTESDFFTHYKDENLNPIFYEVSVCSKCGYAFSETFSNSFPPLAVEQIKTQISANWTEQDFSGERTVTDAIAAYKLALVSGTIKQEKSIVMAGLCLRLAWLYRILNDSEQEKRFMNLALEKYKDSYAESDYLSTKMSEMRLIYLIAELSRRLGLREEAVKNFSKIVNHRNRALEPNIVEAAREQWYLIREEDKTNTNIEQADTVAENGSDKE